VRTTWEKPEDFHFPDEPDKSSDTEPPKKKKKFVEKEIEFDSKEEAVAAFKGLLLAKEISPASKWNDVIKICSSDSSWEACEDILTTGERKQALAEYQTKRANDLRANERQEKIRTREAFMQLLTDNLSAVKGFSAWTSRFDDVRDSLSRDDRFHAVVNELLRESLFADFCEEFKKREERKKRNKKRETEDGFNSFLKEKEEQGSLSFASTWNTFMSSLDDKDRKDPRFGISSFMSDSDRQLYFADYVIKLQKAEDDKRTRIRGARHRAEKAQREAFLDALNELSEAGKIVPSSRWRSVEPLLSSIQSYGPVYDQDREAPRDMFEEFAAEWNESYRRDRSFLSQLVYPSNGKQIVVTPDTTIEEFSKALLDAAADSPDMYRQARRIINRSDPVSSARLYLHELALDAKGLNGTAIIRRGSASRRRDDDSSEDEGEIVEDGEVEG
jgi:pre-mRNA-processing factor 40